MKNTENNPAPSPSGGKDLSKIRLFIFLLEIALVAILLIVWFRSESMRSSRSLWVLFFYSFPSQFLISVIPHEPVFIYFCKFYTPEIVTGVAIAGTLCTEVINYTAFQFVVDLNRFGNIKHSRYITKVIDIYGKAPFISLLVAAFTPIPFYPFRFLVVLARYPLIKYLLAVFIARSVRFYILALIGYAIKIPDKILLILFVCLILLFNGPLLKTYIQSKRAKWRSEKV